MLSLKNAENVAWVVIFAYSQIVSFLKNIMYDNDENEEKSTRRDVRSPERAFEEVVAEKLENVEKHFTYFNRRCWLLDGKLANT